MKPFLLYLNRPNTTACWIANKEAEISYCCFKYWRFQNEFIHWLIFCLLLIVNFHADAFDLSPEITYFYDGDTVKIKDALSEYKLRLTDIDAPERNQTYGKTSRRALINLCKNAEVHVYVTGMDKYQRHLGKLICNDQDASIYMLKNGHAWFNRRYSMDYSLDLLEQESRIQKLGLWEQKTPTPPWRWRKKHPH